MASGIPHTLRQIRPSGAKEISKNSGASCREKVEVWGNAPTFAVVIARL
jgi:hypothetical protein